MRRAFLIILALVFHEVSFAQNAYNFYRLAVGIGGGLNRYYGDINTRIKTSSTFSTGLDYYLTPFISTGVEIQKGSIAAGDSINDPHFRRFKNSYTALIAHGKIQLGQVAHLEYGDPLYHARGFYVGTGAGLILNNQTDIRRTRENPDGNLYTFPGKDKSINLIMPANVGINFALGEDAWGYTRFLVNFNYQFNVTFGENIDGYADPRGKFQNKYPDMLGITTLGFRYLFGAEGVY